jgi:hypothetical protein
VVAGAPTIFVLILGSTNRVDPNIGVVTTFGRQIDNHTGEYATTVRLGNCFWIPRL